MPRIAVHLMVADYAKWREGFDKGAAERAKHGVTTTKVYRNADNGNEVVVTTDVTDAAKAIAGIRGNEIREAMKKSGVQGEPTIMVANPA